MLTKSVLAWRIQEAQPHGLTMWFDPSCEVPILGITPSDSEVTQDLSLDAEAAAGTMLEEAGGTLEGRETKTSDYRQLSLPLRGILPLKETDHGETQF